MASVSITVPDSLVPRLISAARASFPQYAALSDDAAFKAITADFWKTILANYERGAADAVAITKANTDSAGIR
jgi:hypothetical protein